LVLLSEFINRFIESSEMEHLSIDLPDRFRGELSQYFGNELFSSEPQQVQQFLIKSSVCEPIEVGFINDLLGEEKAEEILQAFSRRNLFVQAIYDSKKGWLFRYHQLFRHYLRTKFESEIDSGRAQIVASGAAILEQRGDYENSVKYYLGKGSIRRPSRSSNESNESSGRWRKTNLSVDYCLSEDMVQSNPCCSFILPWPEVY
jgi:ATP/maltotriose-dependent transcriptional regulator MalT